MHMKEKPPHRFPTPNFHLQAANRYKITIYSQQILLLEICLGRTFQWGFVVVEVPYRTTGADYLSE